MLILQNVLLRRIFEFERTMETVAEWGGPLLRHLQQA